MTPPGEPKEGMKTGENISEGGGVCTYCGKYGSGVAVGVADVSFSTPRAAI